MTTRAIQFSHALDWKDPLLAYEKILAARARNLARLADKPGAFEPLLQYYLDGHWAEFICDWGVTYDPRATDLRLQYRPFILSERQIQYVDWVYQRFVRQQRGVCRKHRDAGMSWINAFIGILLWLARPGSVITYGSQKEEKVDAGDGNPDSLFWKIRSGIRHLPKPFVPEQWERASKNFLVVNPNNGATLIGEIGDNIGRGGRSTIAMPDEFGELAHPQHVESALIANTECCIYGGTIPTSGWRSSHFYLLEQRMPEAQVFVFQWEEDPRKRQNPELPPEQEPWYIKTEAEASPAVFKTQYLMIDDAASAVQFVDTDTIRAAFKRRASETQLPFDVAWRLSIDAAGMGNDKIKLWRRRGRLNLPVLTMGKMDGIQLARVVQDVARELLKSGPLELICLENDGPGISCADQLRYSPFASILVAVHTGAKLADGAHYNWRAWLHDQAKTYLAEQEPIIPESQMFLRQATAIHYSHKGGALLIESKEQYRARFAAGNSLAEKLSSPSPDEWDSFVLSFMPPRGKSIKSLTPSFSMGKASTWKPKDTVMAY